MGIPVTGHVVAAGFPLLFSDVDSKLAAAGIPEADGDATPDSHRSRLGSVGLDVRHRYLLVRQPNSSTGCPATDLFRVRAGISGCSSRTSAWRARIGVAASVRTTTSRPGSCSTMGSPRSSVRARRAGWGRRYELVGAGATFGVQKGRHQNRRRSPGRTQRARPRRLDDDRDQQQPTHRRHHQPGHRRRTAAAAARHTRPSTANGLTGSSSTDLEFAVDGVIPEGLGLLVAPP